MIKSFSIFLFFLATQFYAYSSKVKIIPKGGIYNKPLYVKLKTDSNLSIYYTLDGSMPGFNSFYYADSILVDGVAIIRAVSYVKGVRSKVNTQSYFCDRVYSLPIVSIVSSPDNFWSYERGIYVKGCCAGPGMPYYGANFWKSWEYTCNIEMYNKEGLCFNQLAGMSLFGGYSRMLPQKSLAIIARKKYGKSRFKYSIFNERNIKSYKSFIIRNSGGDFKRTQLRDAFMTQLAKPTGVAIQAYEPVIVFINGKYWGIQNLREKISEHYLADNYKVDKDKVDILRHNGVKRHGYSKNYKQLLRFLRTTDLTDDKIIDSLSQFMNIHDFIRYNISEVYSDNKDAGGNIRYFRERKPKAKWRWIFYDLDLGLSNDDKKGFESNTLKTFTTKKNEVWPNPAWSTFIIRSLLVNNKVKNQYINTFSDYLNTYFHADTANALLDKLSNIIKDEIPYHQKRWKSTEESWERNIEIVRKFVKLRPQNLWKHLKLKFDLDTTVLISVVHPGTDICQIKYNSLKLKGDYRGLYFNTVPQQIKVKPKHDYELIGWEGRTETANTIEFIASEKLILKPIIKAKGSSGFKGDILLNEVCFNQPKQDSSKDWIELYNNTENKIDLSKWLITDKRYKDGFTLPKMCFIAPKSYLILCKNQTNFNAHYTLDSNLIIDKLNFKLSNKGEQIKLYDDKGLVVDYFDYNNEFLDIDTAFSLALIHPDSLTSINRWLIQKPSPLNDNFSFINIKQAELNRRTRNRIFLYVAIGLGALVLIILFFRKRRGKKQVVLPSGATS